MVFYANGLFNHDVTSLVLSNGKPTTAIQDAFNSAFICIVGKIVERGMRGCARKKEIMGYRD